MPKHLLLLFACAFLLSTSIQAQTESAIIKQPKAVMPKGAETVGLYGDNAIQVKVDNAGKVESAKFLPGPADACPTVTNPIVNAARESAKAAALKAKFKPDPALIEPSTAVLNYPFALPPTVKESDVPVKMELRPGPIILSGSSDPGQGDSSHGVLNGKAVSLPKPSYPAAARAVKASGTVSVLVTIDVDGTMLSADATDGHPLLRSTARSAACKAVFTQTLLEGHPVKVRGIINYNFIP